MSNFQESSSMYQKYDYQIKLVVIGDSSVGKTCLMERYARERFHSSYITTIGVDYLIKTISLEDKIVKLQLWDTAGQERFRSITRSFYKGAHGMILVYDVTNQESYDAVGRWVNDIARFSTEIVPVLLVANKSDLASQRVVSTKQGQALADSFGMRFIETSAKSAAGVEDAFVAIATHAIRHMVNRLNGGHDRPRMPAGPTIRLHKARSRLDKAQSLLGRNCC